MPYLILSIGSILFVLSVIGLYSPSVSKFDLHTIQVLYEHRNKTLDHMTIVLAYLGGVLFVLFFTLLWCLFCAWYKKYSTLAFILMGVGGSIVLGWLLKWCFNRSRPPEVYHLVENYGASFPSVHSVYAATFASLIMLISKNHSKQFYFIGVASLWLLFMGLSRIYAGVHYPTDVLAGWSIGFIWISLLWLWLQSRMDKNKLFVR